MPVLSKGANAPVTVDSVRVTLTWAQTQPAVDVDVSGLLCGLADRVSSDTDFVFFNQQSHPSGSVRHLGYSQGPGTTTDSLEVDLARVPPGVETIKVAASAERRFGDVAGLVAHVLDAATQAVLLEYPIEAGSETALIVGELYRRGGGWKFRAIGQGYADGLAGLARDFGITVDDVAEPAPAHAPAPAPAPAPVPAPSSQSSGGIDWMNPPVPAGYEI